MSEFRLPRITDTDDQFAVPIDVREWTTEELVKRTKKAPHIGVVGHFVYILWGEDRTRPLYVGETAHLMRRLGNHRDKAERVLTIQLLAFDSEQERSLAEAQLIRHYQPPLNTLHAAGNGGRRGPIRRNRPAQRAYFLGLAGAE